MKEIILKLIGINVVVCLVAYSWWVLLDGLINNPPWKDWSLMFMAGLSFVFCLCSTVLAVNYIVPLILKK